MKTYSEVRQNVTDIPTGFIVHGVNCQGAMGSGIAGAIAGKWPSVRDAYMDFINQKKASAPFQSSSLLGTVQRVAVRPNLIVVNAFTQDFFGADGKRYASPEAISKALNNIFGYVEDRVQNDEMFDPTRFHVYMPQIGCGLGGLSWDTDVEPVVTAAHRGKSFPLTIITL